MAEYRSISKHILEKLPKEHQKPKIGIICGSGLKELSSTLTNSFTIPYDSIPGFPVATVQGHVGELVFGMIDGVSVVCVRGRFHFYEGKPMDVVALPVRIMRCLGVQLVIVTNAAGGLNRSYKVGDIVCIMDHLGLPMISGNNPLIGPNDNKLGVRFPASTDAYDADLQQIFVNSAHKLGFQNCIQQNGTYAFVSGPMYESKAESRFLLNAGCDSVGMSTVPEIVAAKHCGMKVLCLSLITNKVIIDENDGSAAASHEEVLETSAMRSKQMQSLVKDIIISCCSGNRCYMEGLENLPPINLEPYSIGKKKEIMKIGGVPVHCIASSALTVTATVLLTLFMSDKLCERHKRN